MAERKIITLGTIRDYILRYYPELLWWDGFNKHEKFDSNKSYKHRQGMPNEIRIEFDSDDHNKNWSNINLTALELFKKGFSFAIYYVEGGRSPHLHLYDLDELDFLTYEQRTKFREMFLREFCPKDSNPDMGLCDEKHLMALEFANHFKYGKPKQLLYYFYQGMNVGLDYYMFNKASELKDKKQIKFNPKTLKLGEQLVLGKRDKIIKSLNFEEVLEKYNVKYKGKMALCPFHNDKDMSLSFTNEKGLWKCFGCQEKGDIITLIKKLEELKRDGNKRRS